ncbi:sensor histidine kinase [Labilibacter sediminis]|nr:sensor histidine kinase [Labilibacter sediminis]
MIIKFKKIRLQLQLIVGTLVVMIIAALGFVHYHSVKDSLFKEYRNKQLYTVLVASQSHFQSILEKAFESSELLADDPTLCAWFEEGEVNDEYKDLVLERLDLLKKDYEYQTVFAVNSKTKNYWRDNYTLLDVVSEYDPDDSWFFQAIDKKVKTSINYDHNRELQSTVLFINVLMGNPDNALGVAGVGIDPSVLISQFHAHKPSKNSRIWLIDNKGIVIMSTKVSEINNPLSRHVPINVVNKILSHDTEGVVSDKKINNKKVELAYMPIGDTSYRLLILVPDEDLFPVLNIVRNQTLIFSLIFLFITLVVVKFLAQGITRPLSRFIVLSEKIAGGDLTLKTDVELLDRADEIGRLALAFDTMKIRLVKAIDKLKQANYDLKAEKIHLKLANRDLNRALVKASESEKLTQSFLANISHEIRTPMNSIMGFSQLLEIAELDSFEHKKYAALVVKGGQQLLSILDSIINLSKIESGMVKPHWQKVNIHQLLKDTFDLYEVLAVQAGLNMYIETNDIKNDAVMDTDAVLFQHVLNNLVSNAIKYTEKGTVVLGCKRNNDQVTYYVSDTGVGIPEDEQEKIFEAFWQVENNHSINSGGAGLGLAIVKKITSILGGNIRLSSVPQKGSTFSVDLPVYYAGYNRN